MNWLVAVAEFVVNEILAVPAYLIGIITAVGLIALRKSVGQVIGGALKATLGFLLIGAGATLVVANPAFASDAPDNLFAAIDLLSLHHRTAQRQRRPGHGLHLTHPRIPAGRHPGGLRRQHGGHRSHHLVHPRRHGNFSRHIALPA